ncbi:MAG: FtsX-like permease family protein [Oscillospiraceae bacterium]|nr:FtsX-like permease family protein [Oscillospiraceae bacterium]
MADCLKNAMRNILRKRLRSVLTITGIAIGVLSVIIISTIGDLGKQTINNELNSIGIGGLAVSCSESATSAELYTTELNEIKSDDSVFEAMPLMLEVTECQIRGEKNKCMVWGVDNGAAKIVSLELLYGRLVNKSDVASSNNVCVVDETYAMETYKRKNIVGKKIEVLLNGGYEDFEVVGVVSSGGNVLQNLMGNYIPSFMYIPFSTLQRLSGRTNFDQIAVKLKQGVDADKAATQIAARLEVQNGVKDSIRVENLANQKEKLNNILNIVTFILAIIAGISLIVAGLSIMTVMLVSVHERTREIGIKKSIGASKATIMMEFLMEALLISLIGSIIGIIIGVTISFFGCMVMGIGFIMNMDLILFCIAFTIAVGVIFGVYPATKAAGLKPVDALRYE